LISTETNNKTKPTPRCRHKWTYRTYYLL